MLAVMVAPMLSALLPVLTTLRPLSEASSYHDSEDTGKPEAAQSPIAKLRAAIQDEKKEEGVP